MKQAAEIVIVRLHEFRRACTEDYDTFMQCFDHVLATSGWTRDEVFSMLANLHNAHVETLVRFSPQRR